MTLGVRLTQTPLSTMMLNVRSAVARVLAGILYRKLPVLHTPVKTGIRLVDGSAGHEGAAETLLGVQDAIEMLFDCSQVHARWLSRCANRLVLTPPMRSPAAFERITRSILLSCDVGGRHDSAAIVTFLTHEIAHARVAALLGRSTTRDPELQKRVERRCVREQLGVILRLDPHHYLVSWSVELVQAANESRLIPSNEQVVAIAQRTYRRLRTGGYPRWVGRLGVRIAFGVRRARRH
jgi:hypothetical protein